MLTFNTQEMHSSQLRKKGNPSQKGLHPGTPRPNPENFQTRRDTTTPIPSLKTSEERPTKKSFQSSANSKSLKRILTPSESLPDFLIWVKNEPFDFGLLSPYPCPKIGINILRKIAEYCKEKPGHYPELSLSQWNRICKYKMQLTVLLSSAYFRVFDILVRPACMWTQATYASECKPTSNAKANEDASASLSLSSSSMSNKEDLTGKDNAADFDEHWDAKSHRIQKQGYQDGGVAERLKVDTLQFLVFLYIQHFLRLHKKYFARPYTNDEPWPDFRLHGGGDRTTSKSGQHRHGSNNSIPEQQHAEFLISNLGDIIDYLSLLSNNEKEDDFLEQRITIPVVKALSFILGAASTTLDREFRTLDECLVIEDIASQLDYCKESGTVSRNSFLAWVRENLKLNPWGPSSAPIPQYPVAVTTGIWEDPSNFNLRNRIYWNTQCYPKAWFLISGVEKQILLIDSLEAMSSIKVHRCKDAHIYIPGVHNMILVRKCHGIHLNLGVATKIVKIMDSSNVKLSGVGRLFIICDVTKSTFHLLTPTSPVICGSKNRDILLSPYNTSYPNLGIHMKMAGISTKVQKWNKPLEIGTDGLPLEKSHSANYAFVQPAQYKVALFPFKIRGGGKPDAIPGNLPNPYQHRLDSAEEMNSNVRMELHNRKLSDEDATQIYQCTLRRFNKWLKETGNYDQIVGLRSFQKTVEEKSESPLICSKGHAFACVTKTVKSFINSNISYGGVGDIVHARNLRHENKASSLPSTQPSFRPVSSNGGGENPDESFEIMTAEPDICMRFSNFSIHVLENQEDE